MRRERAVPPIFQPEGKRNRKAGPCMSQTVTSYDMTRRTTEATPSLRAKTREPMSFDRLSFGTGGPGKNSLKAKTNRQRKRAGTAAVVRCQSQSNKPLDAIKNDHTNTQTHKKRDARPHLETPEQITGVADLPLYLHPQRRRYVSRLPCRRQQSRSRHATTERAVAGVDGARL